MEENDSTTAPGAPPGTPTDIRELTDEEMLLVSGGDDDDDDDDDDDEGGTGVSPVGFSPDPMCW